MAHRPRILALDDDEVFLKTVRHVGRERGIGITTGTSLEDMGFIGSLFCHDAVLLDLNMEPHSGVEIAEIIHAMKPDMPVFFASAYTIREWDATEETPRILPKTWGVEQILNLVTTEMQSRDAHDEWHGKPKRAARRRKVLILDDDTLFLGILQRVSRRFNLDLVVCRTVAEFIDANAAGRQCITVIDHNLEDGAYPHGQVLGDTLVDLVESSPIYLISANEQAEAAAARRDDKIAGFIPKSLGVRDILRFLRDVDLRSAKSGVAISKRAVG